MAVLYKKQQKKNPRTKEALWYPVVKSIKLVREHEVAELLADETTLNPKEAEMAVAQLAKVVMRLLQQGYTVQMGDWASFNLTVSAVGVEAEKDCTATSIKRVRAHCRFSRKFLEELQKTTFMPATNLTETKKKGEDPEGEG